MRDDTIHIRHLAGPGLVWAAGLTLVILSAPKTVYLNRGVALGFFLLCLGTFLALYALCREYERTGKERPAFLDVFFPDYPVVGDQDELTRRLTGFRRSFSEFLSGGGMEENSGLQGYASQLMWHTAALQKKRLMKKGLTLELDSERRAYSGRKSCVRVSRYFDGRYEVSDVYEEIFALRTIKKDGRIIGRLRDSEAAHYTLLSAKQAGGNLVTCPCCGHSASRENLIDGCDHCGTRFTLEDMENKVAGFGFRRDFRTGISKKEAVRELMFPWTTLIVMLPLVYFGLIGAFVYMPETNIFLRLITGLFAAGLLGLLGWSLKSMFLVLVTPLLLLVSMRSKTMDRRLVCSRKEEEEQEKKMAEEVRKTDPLFSIQSFFCGVQNKISAVHFAFLPAEINAFSDTDLSSWLEKYRDVVDVDFRKLTMESYKEDAGLRTASVSGELRLLELKGGRIRERSERLRLTMVKDAGCRTQAVCGPAVLTCRGCGAALSLMEGKTCRYCGRDLDLKAYDWVIAGYGAGR